MELELELIQTQMTQKPMLRAEMGMRVRCAQVKIVKRIVKSSYMVGMETPTTNAHSVP